MSEQSNKVYSYIAHSFTRSATGIEFSFPNYMQFIPHPSQKRNHSDVQGVASIMSTTYGLDVVSG
jgi:hypothetical protein